MTRLAPELQPVWRIAVAVLAGQALGFITALSLLDHGVLTGAAWLGGLAASLPGYAVGLLWQARHCPEKRTQWFQQASFLGITTLLATMLALDRILQVV